MDLPHADSPTRGAEGKKGDSAYSAMAAPSEIANRRGVGRVWTDTKYLIAFNAGRRIDPADLAWLAGPMQSFQRRSNRSHTLVTYHALILV
jgi:hypothetical protein